MELDLSCYGKRYVLRASEDLGLLRRKREEILVTVRWRKYHYEEYHNLHFSLIIIIIIIINLTFIVPCVVIIF